MAVEDKLSTCNSAQYQGTRIVLGSGGCCIRGFHKLSRLALLPLLPTLCSHVVCKYPLNLCYMMLVNVKLYASVDYISRLQTSLVKFMSNGTGETKLATIEFFTIGLSDAFLSDYLTDLKLHRTK